jgi:hypothetical protein
VFKSNISVLIKLRHLLGWLLKISTNSFYLIF